MRAVITLTVPGTSSAGRARFMPWRGHVIHLAMEAVAPARPASPARPTTDRRRRRRFGRIPAHGPRPAIRPPVEDRRSDRCRTSPADCRKHVRATGPTRTRLAPSPRALAAQPAHRAMPSSSCTATSAPARPPSCGTCCAHWACRAASRARPTPWSSRYEAPDGLGDLAFRLLPLHRSARMGRRRLSRHFAGPGPQAGRMARERRRPAAAGRPA